MNYFADEDVRHSPVVIDGKYLALIYKAEEDGKKVFKVLRSIDELPMDRDKSLVTPITYAELYYITLIDVWDRFPMIIARYPIAGTGSDIPCNVQVRTTMNSDKRYMLKEDWSGVEDKVYPRFPIYGDRFNNAIGPAVSALSGASADKPLATH